MGPTFASLLDQALGRLRFGPSRKVPLHLQGERAECGLACLSMVAAFHGRHVDMPELRTRFAVSDRGMTAADLCDAASQLGLVTRAVRLELDELGQLSLPAILHWEMKHFVVLVGRRADRWLVHDPAFGERLVGRDGLDAAFTGVAIELSPAVDFVPSQGRARRRNTVSLGAVPGLRGVMGHLLALGLALEVLGLIGPMANQFMIDQAIVSLDLDLVLTISLGLGLTLLLQVLLQGYRSWIVSYVGTRVSLQLGGSVLKHLLALPLDYFGKRSVGDISSRFDSVFALQRTLTTGLVEAFIDGVMVLGTFAMIAAYSRLFALIAVGTALAYWMIRYGLMKQLRQVSDTQLAAMARRQSHFLETLRAIRSIKHFGKSNLRLQAWLNASVDEQNAALKINRYSIVFRFASALIFGIDSIVFLAIGATQIMAGQLSVGMLMALLAYKGQFSMRTVSFIDKGFEWRLLALHFRRIADICETPAEPDEPQLAMPANLEPTLEIHDLGFRYSPDSAHVLRGLDLHVQAGESVTLIGPSGAGKSTLIKLLTGTMQPTEGSIRIGGIPLRQLQRQIVGRFLCAVMQDDPVLSGSILENITFFDAKPDIEHAIECARTVELHTTILAMPMGYQTLLGEMGASLSGGERQRLLLARALYQRPRILILDEATAHIDIFTERKITQKLRGLGMTRIVVAHRRETALSTDRQVRLSELSVSLEPVIRP